MIRYVKPNDCPQVHDIDIKCYDFVWNTRKFITTDTYIYEVSNRIVAFLSWEIHEGDLLILKLGVTPAFRRQGIGTNLLNSVLSRGLITHCLVEETELPGQLLLKKNGFTCQRIIKNIYLMGNNNGIDNLAGGLSDRTFSSNDPEVGGLGTIGPQAAEFEPPQDYP